MNLAPFKREKVLREKVLSYLKKNPRGKTTTELNKELKISRKTIEKHLQLLVSENEIYMKQFGPTRVYYPNHRLHYLDFEKLILNNKCYWFDIMENEYGKFLAIQEKRKNNDKFITKGSILIPLEKVGLFVNSLDKILNSSKLKKI